MEMTNPIKIRKILALGNSKKPIVTQKESNSCLKMLFKFFLFNKVYCSNFLVLYPNVFTFCEIINNNVFYLSSREIFQEKFDSLKKNSKKL